MPAYAAKMSDQEIADVDELYPQRLGQCRAAVTAAQVAKARRTK